MILQRFIMISILTGIILSCKQNTLEENEVIRFGIPEDTPYDCSYFQYYEKDNLICALNYEAHRIEIFNINSKDKMFTIPLDKIRYKIAGFCFHDPDSVLLLSKYMNIIYLVNRKGDILDQWSWKFPEDMETFEIPFINKDFTVEFKCYMSNPLILLDNKIYVGNASFYPPPYELYDKNTGFAYMKNEYPHLIIDISGSKLKINNKTGKWPDVYQHFNCYAPSGDKYSRTINNNSHLVFSYPVDHDVYIYNNDSLLQTVTCKSKYIDKFYPCDYFKFYEDNIYVKNYSIEAPGYFSIIYDKYRDIYYRIACHKHKAKNEDGTLNSLFNKPWSIMVLNNSFKILNEIRMEPGKYCYWNLIVTEEGLLISNNNDLNPDLDKGCFSFTLFIIHV